MPRPRYPSDQRARRRLQLGEIIYLACVQSDGTLWCPICDCEIWPPSIRGEPAIDHVIPRSRGGSDELENLQLVHAKCNAWKGQRTMEEVRDELDSLEGA